MSNDLSNIILPIMGRALTTLRENCYMARLVNKDFSDTVAQKGETIRFPVPVAQAASDVSPANTPPSPSDTTPTVVNLTLDQWKKSTFYLTEKQQSEIHQNVDFVQMQADEAVRALANSVNDAVFATYTDVYGHAGTAGTNPFASNLNNANSIMKVLSKQVCPQMPRNLVIDFEAESSAKNQTGFSSALEAGDTSVKVRGEIGKKFGLDWFADHAVPYHTAGTAMATGVTLSVFSGCAAGATTIKMAVDTGTTSATLVAGDVLTIGDYQYNVGANVTVSSSGTTVTLGRKAATTISTSDVVTKVASHRVNLAFHPYAFALGMRSLGIGNIPNGTRTTIRDPISGISLTLDMTYQYHQWMWEMSILYGVKCVRPELAARLLG